MKIGLWLRSADLQARFGVLLVCGLVLFFSLPSAALPGQDPTLSGNWFTGIYLTPSPTVGSSFGLDSTLSLTYSYAGLDLRSASSFGNDGTGFRRQSFGLDTRIGIMDLSSEAVFSPQHRRLNYWISEASTTFAGFTISQTFLLDFDDYPEDIEPGPSYGAGVEITISGKTPGEADVEFSSRFGMEESPLEQEGVEEGSGYDIIVRDDGEYVFPPSSLQYESSTIDVSNLTFGCCQFSNTTLLTREGGFEYSRFDFLIEAEDLPFYLGTEVEFSPAEKTVSITPNLTLDAECVELYLGFVREDNRFNPQLKGFGLHNLELADGVTVSSLTSLKNNLHRFKGTSDIKLRAHNYVIDPITPAYYDELDFDQVFSISRNREGLFLALDTYFDMAGSDQLFDLHKFTGNATYRVADQFQLGMGLEVLYETSETTVLLEADYSF